MASIETSIDTRRLPELMWPSELTPEFLLRYKIIYIQT